MLQRDLEVLETWTGLVTKKPGLAGTIPQDINAAMTCCRVAVSGKPLSIRD